jgi:dTDP-glucose pyrophosphorylase
MNILIPMAGLGDRFKRAGFLRTKPMIPILDKPMIEWAINSLGVNGNFIFILNNKNEEFNELKNLLNKICKNPKIIDIDYLTEGPASTSLLAKEYINNDDPLLIINCDQIMTWDSNNFLEFIKKFKDDGFVVTYEIKTIKNSYVKIDEFGYAIKFAEKEIISDYSLNGIHYWTKGKDFVMSAEKMIKKNIRVNGEFYIAPTYNELLLENKKIKIYHIDKNKHWSVGTPEDLNIFLEKIKNENI